MDDDEKIEENLELLEKKMHAKKAILREILKTVDTEKEKKESAKSRKYIRDMLNCEISLPSTQNTSCCSLELLDSFRFQQHVVSRIRVSNWLPNNNLTIRISGNDCSVRWLLFESEHSMNPQPSISKNSTAIMFMTLPFSAFFQTDQVSVTVQSCEVPSQSRLFHPSFYSVIGANETPEALKETINTVQIDWNKASEELDLKSIEFCDEQKAMQIFQSLLVVASVLPVSESIDLSIFRREFPRFSCVDFDTWRLFVGTEIFDGVFLYIPAEEESAKNIVLGTNSQISRAFLHVLKAKCCKTL